jgi:hypothetical protein
MGDIRDGCEAYQKAIELSPDMLEAWLNLGQACKEEARVDEAERALTKVRMRMTCCWRQTILNWPTCCVGRAGYFLGDCRHRR